MKKTILIFTKKFLSLRWFVCSISGIVICIIIGLVPRPYSQETPSTPTPPQPRLISSGMVVTPDTALRGAEGELLIFIGDPPRSLTPFMLRSAAKGTIACSTRETNCRYDFQFSQTIIDKATDELKVGVLDITAINPSSAKTDAAVWASWRFDSDIIHKSYGFALDAKDHPEETAIRYEAVWNPASTWCFTDRGFVCNEKFLYYISKSLGWDKQTWVRRILKPYKDLNSNSIVGVSYFKISLDPKAQAAIQLLVPYKPLPVTQEKRFAVFIPPAE